jgi:hypothetical protein
MGQGSFTEQATQTPLAQTGVGFAQTRQASPFWPQA